MAKTAQKINATTQKFTEILDIQDDVVLLTGGNACLIIEMTPVNFSLLSAKEQDARIYSYASLLNSLSFHIQILVRSKKLDISSYLKLLDEDVKKAGNDSLRQQIVLYKDFIQNLVKENVILDKKFYIVIPFSSLEKGVKGARKAVDKGSVDAEFANQAKASLHSKAESLHSELGRLNMHARTLIKEELIKLFYEIYNDIAIGPNDISTNLEAPIVKKEVK